MPMNNYDYEPLNEVWLSIVTAVSTALLVNVVTGFTFRLMPIIQVLVLIFACVMIGLYARKKSDALLVIKKRIELEGLTDPVKTGARRKVVEEEWETRRVFLRRSMQGALLLIVISVALLVFQGWEHRKSMEADTDFKNEVSQQLQDIETKIDSLGSGENRLTEQDR